MEVEKKLVDDQKAFNKDSYFNQQDTQKILSVLQYFKEHQNTEKILRETLKYKESIGKINDSLEELSEQNFDQMLDDFETTLNDNDLLMDQIKEKLQGEFLKVVESL